MPMSICLTLTCLNILQGCRRSGVVTFTAIRLRDPGFKPRPGHKFENENFCFRHTPAVVKACHPSGWGYLRHRYIKPDFLSYPIFSVATDDCAVPHWFRLRQCCSTRGPQAYLRWPAKVSITYSNLCLKTEVIDKTWQFKTWQFQHKSNPNDALHLFEI